MYQNPVIFLFLFSNRFNPAAVLTSSSMTSSSGYTVVGFAMYYFTYDPWIGKLLYLEDFYVMKEFRGVK